jgi:hypothetical protein
MCDLATLRAEAGGPQENSFPSIDLGLAMPWRDSFLLHFGPGLLGGITLGRWLRLLRDNRFAVSPSCFLRAAAISLQSIQNSVWGCYENWRFGSRVKEVALAPPLFILGHWRSGTTHLHNLLAVDERFAFANNYQVLYPHTFLTTELTSSRLMGWFMPKRRPMDNIEWTLQSPQEDEFALCVSTSQSPCMSWVFPRRRDHYDRYLTFRGVSQREIEQWQEALLLLIKKLTWKYGRPLVLKSPPHTARIKLLLQMFPQARFVHIHRNPYVVFPSTRRTFEVNIGMHCLQSLWPSDLDEWILRQYRTMYDVFFEERRLIPEGHFQEVCFEELEKDPMEQMRQLYAALDLPTFEQSEPALRRYVDSIAGYKKNAFPDLPADLRARIAAEWRPCFEEWGYSV